eukprot:146502_1
MEQKIMEQEQQNEIEEQEQLFECKLNQLTKEKNEEIECIRTENSDLQQLKDRSNEPKNRDSITHLIATCSQYTQHIQPITTPMTLFRGAFPDVFGDINDVKNREIWGDAQGCFDFVYEV